MMGYKPIHCESLGPKEYPEPNSARKALYQKRKEDLVNELVNPICIISNANEILSSRLGKFVDDDTRTYFDMVSRAITKTKTLVEELRQETS
jgi:light-regulated signal transduction histidine kinase (bacteriophytochrome)